MIVTATKGKQTNYITGLTDKQAARAKKGLERDGWSVVIEKEPKKVQSNF